MKYASQILHDLAKTAKVQTSSGFFDRLRDGMIACNFNRIHPDCKEKAFGLYCAYETEKTQIQIKSGDHHGGALLHLRLACG